MSNAPATSPAGVTDANDTYTINNDYIYPRYTVPVMLQSQSALNNSGIEYGMNRNGPYAQMGLLRGYLYPVDVDAPGWDAATGTVEGQADALSAADRARQEAIEAATTRDVSGISVPLTAEELEAAGLGDTPLQPVGPGTARGVPSQSSDPIKTPKKIRYAQG